MAKWEYRGKKKDIVSVYYFVDKKRIRLPRTKVEHLDRLRPDQIDEWVAAWSRLHEVHKRRKDSIKLPADWELLLKEFESYLAEERQLDRRTISDHLRHLRVALPFFVEKECRTFNDFPAHSRLLKDWLKDHMAKTQRRIRSINISLRVFWNYLKTEKDLPLTDIHLKADKAKKRHTPLKVTITPDEVLEFCSTALREDIKLIALLGYFFSLRPQEILAAKPENFMAGKKAAELDSGRAMGQAGLYDRLAFYCEQQQAYTGTKEPKSSSKGWISCFDERAARLIVAMIKDKDRAAPLIQMSLDVFIKLWRKHGFPNTKSKDMRRASLYHLGHFTNIPAVALKNHARHKYLETTMLYCRRPEDGPNKEEESFDLDG